MTSGHHPPPPPPHDPARPPGLETPARLRAGASDPPTTARLTSHVGGCPICAATLRALDAVRADLRSLPPARVPESVAERLDATLARLRTDAAARRIPPQAGTDGVGDADASPAGTSARPGDPGPAPTSTGADDLTDARERRRERSRRFTTLVAASLVTLAALVGAGTAVLTRSPDKAETNQATALSPDERRTSGGYQSGGGAAAESVPSGEAPAPRPLPAYTRDTLRAAVASIEEQASLDVIEAAGTGGPAGAMADVGRRARCVDGIPGVAGQPSAVRQVVFEGRLAFVFVYDRPAGGRRVLVVGTDCGLGGSPTVLYRSPD